MSTTTHTLRTEYPLAGADDGLPVEIRFTYRGGSPDYWNKAGGHWEQGWGAEIELESVVQTDRNITLPPIVWAAIESWARDWLDTDEGNNAACDTAHCDLIETGPRGILAKLTADETDALALRIVALLNAAEKHNA